MSDDKLRQAKLRLRRATGIFLAAVFLICAALFIWVIRPGLERKSYKLEYVDQIRQYAGEYDLDPYLVAAVIHVESRGEADALSGAGAVGLMQIMPDTGAWIAQKLDEATPPNLNDPALSIRYGCWYLRFLQDRYAVTDTAVAAYNAGHNAVARWLEDPQYSADGASLTEIPYPETRDYVEKVSRAREMYETLYPDAF